MIRHEKCRPSFEMLCMWQTVIQSERPSTHSELDTMLKKLKHISCRLVKQLIYSTYICFGVRMHENMALPAFFLKNF